MERKRRKPTAWEMYRAEKERLERENARLVAEVERLERWRDAAAGEATIEIGRLAGHSESLERENDRLKQENMRLREALSLFSDWNIARTALEYTDS
jgi:cell division protein FtsB